MTDSPLRSLAYEARGPLDRGHEPKRGREIVRARQARDRRCDTTIFLVAVAAVLAVIGLELPALVVAGVAIAQGMAACHAHLRLYRLRRPLVVAAGC